MMERLIRYEFRKLFRHRAFYICLAVSAALVAVSAFSTKALAGLVGMELVPAVTDTLGSFYSDGMLTILLGIFTALFVSEDAQAGTLKNICARGYSRIRICFSKYIVSCVSVLIFCAVDMLFAVIVPAALGAAAGEPSSMFVPDLAGTVVLLLAMNTLFFVISILSGKGGMSIALNIVVPTVVSLLLSLADLALGLTTFSLNDYWLDGLLTAAAGAADMGVLLKSIGIGILWAAALTAAGAILHNRQEM